MSYSMDPEEQASPREGYILGLTSREFLQVLSNGNHGRIAITYFEWAGLYDQKIILPCRLIDGPESAEAGPIRSNAPPIGARRGPRFSGLCNLPSRSTRAAMAGCAALSTFLVTAL